MLWTKKGFLSQLVPPVRLDADRAVELPIDPELVP